ncbi:MAG: 5-(carboxyamino)imidazole ribonucleotide mutase [Chloroflexi bacterium]|nr:5-(carboxyamino)imidazole ribonucleotide mutase [Chloroflexota bacterium]
MAATAPVVAIVMGSDSDLELMRPAYDALREFGIPAEVRVISAHRTPDDALALARGAAARGIRVIIAGAGWAAHLAGVLAAATPLPVIGVPIGSSPLSGFDSLLAVAQMPSGVPVATVAVNGARNAGLLAIRILAASDETLRAHVERFQGRMADTVRAKDAAIREQFA